MKKRLLILAPLLFFVFNHPVQAADISAQASRSSGVAPLAVQFNADIWESSETERRFHDLHYLWDFDDPESGVWGSDGRSKNKEAGPVSTHVFEEPGTYTVKLKVVNPLSGAEVMEMAREFIISVGDPDQVFVGGLTTCISDTAQSDFSGCPDGARK